MTQIKIDPIVELREAHALVEFYRNRAMVNAQLAHDAEVRVNDAAAAAPTGEDT